MKRETVKLSESYLRALRAHLKAGPSASLRPAGGLGQRALGMGLQTLDLAMIHKQALITVVTPASAPHDQNDLVNRAETFFVEAMRPIENIHGAAMETNVKLSQLNQVLHRRTVELAAANQSLRHEIAQRRAAEQALKKSQQHYSQLLEQSRQMQEQLQHLSRQLLQAQEEERKQISRELHDQIAQTLTGINIHLATLKNKARVNNKDLGKRILRTQQLVEKSVDIVHRFARDLRPTVLDDLGLIPALRSLMKDFTQRTGIHIRCKAFAGVEGLSSTKRTVFYRVAQSALANVAQHAKASRVTVSIRKVQTDARMEIRDNGEGFEVERVLFARKQQRLGLLGMRERVEMVGGCFRVESAPGKGATVRAVIPFGNGKRV